MSPLLTRRRLLALGVATCSGGFSGCLVFRSDDAQSLSGTVYNGFSETKTVTVTLTSRDGAVAFAEEYTVGPGRSVQFELDEIERWYSLSTATDGGLSNSVEWHVSRCRSWVEIGLTEARGINYGFSEC